MEELRVDRKQKKKKSSRKNSRDRKKDARDLSSNKKREKKKKKEGSSSSSSGDSDSSGSDSEEDKHLPWVAGKKRKITPEMVLDANVLRFKKRSDLLNFHFRHPGGLAAAFLWQVKSRLGGELPKDTEELKKVDAAGWAQIYANLKEIRDQREVAFMCRLLLELGHNRLGLAADLVAMRVREILLAKRDQGSSTAAGWEKAAVVSLLPGPLPGHTLLPEGAFIA
jgi:hypothetical protein